MKYKTELSNINRMAYPVLLNYLLMSVFEILDKAIVGHYSTQGFAVIGIAAAPIYEITGALGILSVAFNIIAAELHGKRELIAFETAFTVSKQLAVAIGSVFFLLCLAGGSFFFREVYAVNGKTLIELLRYFYPAAFTVLQNMLIFQYSAYYRNRLNTKISFFSTAVSSVVNLFFDVTLVYGLCGMPHLGTAGAAWGSVIGLFAGLLVYQIPYYINKRKLKDFDQYTEKRKTLRTLFKLYPPLFGQEFLESTLFVLIVSGVVARMGTHHMAVYSLLSTVGSIIELPIYAYAMAAQTYALQSNAAGNAKQAGKYLKSGQRFTFLVVLGLSMICYIWRKQIFGWVVADEVITSSAECLIIWIFVLALVKVAYQFYMEYLQGVGKEKYIFASAIIATVVASIGVMILGVLFALPGVYFVMGSKYLILSIVYLRENRKKA